jgi:hypothetical protein
VAIATAAARGRGRMAARCCGPDHLCGNGDDEALPTLGWTAGACPNLESGSCTAATTDPGDVADCLTCGGTTASARAFEFLYERFATPAPAITPCQEAIGEATTLFFGKKGRFLRRCWRRAPAARTRTPAPCPATGAPARPSRAPRRRCAPPSARPAAARMASAAAATT